MLNVDLEVIQQETESQYQNPEHVTLQSPNTAVNKGDASANLSALVNLNDQ